MYVISSQLGFEMSSHTTITSVFIADKKMGTVAMAWVRTYTNMYMNIYTYTFIRICI
jgi:hypothetical protein